MPSIENVVHEWVKCLGITEITHTYTSPQFWGNFKRRL